MSLQSAGIGNDGPSDCMKYLGSISELCPQWLQKQKISNFWSIMSASVAASRTRFAFACISRRIRFWLTNFPNSGSNVEICSLFVLKSGIRNLALKKDQLDVLLKNSVGIQKKLTVN